jgi:hypothetical protein
MASLFAHSFLVFHYSVLFSVFGGLLPSDRQFSVAMVSVPQFTMTVFSRVITAIFRCHSRAEFTGTRLASSIAVDRHVRKIEPWLTKRLAKARKFQRPP